jgi:hypothetical protein
MSACRLQTGLAALIATLVLAACGSVKDAMLERGLPPAYAEGYDDGCSSGKEAAGGLFAETRKDSDRYGTDDQYTQGWSDGFEKCRSEMATMVREAWARNPSRDK